MRIIKNFSRIAKINYVILSYDLLEIVSEYANGNIFKNFNYLNPWHYTKFSRQQKIARRLRLALEELGPIFIKFGQLLSTRPDIFPEEFIFELSLLQDQVKPFASELIHNELLKNYGINYQTIFKEFDYIPLAAASIAQVHSAVLLDDKTVAVKILRPNIRKEIAKDLELLKFFVNNLSLIWSGAKRYRLKEVIVEFERSLADELDLLKEAANASQIKRNFKNNPILHIPEVYWDYCTPDIFVSEKITGIPISDIVGLKKANTNLKVLAERGVKIFFTQVFCDKFFHADMHSGNIFVDVTQPQSPKYIAVDFGIVGTLSSEDQEYLALNLIAFLNQDYFQIAKLHLESGWINENTRIELFASAIRTVCEPIFEKPLKDISFGRLLLRLFQVAEQFDMQVQPQLLLLQKTLIAVEGLGRQLYPELEIWRIAKPYLEKWYHDKYNVVTAMQKIGASIPDWGNLLPILPGLIKNTLMKPKESPFAIMQMEALIRINKNIRNLNIIIVLGLLLLIAVIIFY